MYPIKRKVDVFQDFTFYKAQVELEYDKKIKCLRTYSEGEYTTNEFDEFCKLEGKQFTTTYTP